MDYVIDCIHLRKYLYENNGLKKLMENKGILKIFHGCETDLKILFVNFGISVVNLFDTAKAYMKIKN